MKPNIDALVRHQLWLLFRDHPWIGIQCALQILPGMLVNLVCPNCALRMALRTLRKEEARTSKRFTVLK